jgi:nucleoside triphosphate pyrophosphatase
MPSRQCLNRAPTRPAGGPRVARWIASAVVTRRFVLASASPARRRILEQAGIDPAVVVSGFDEDSVTAPTPRALASHLAAAKARAVAALERDALVLGCDSVLDVDGVPYGKQPDARTAYDHLTFMAGRSGILHTGHCLLDVREGAVTAEALDTGSTTVHFGKPDPAEIEAYVATGEPMQVAGGFTLDGYGGWFMSGIEGDHGTVLGLSLPLLRQLFRLLDVRLTDLWR